MLAASLLAAVSGRPARDFARRVYAPAAHAAPPQTTVFWHAGNFRYLDAEEHDLLTYVDNPDRYPNAGLYGGVSDNRTTRFNALLDSLFAAVEASLDDGNTGDWCDVKNKADIAGYEVLRFYDTVSGRWFVHGRDATQFGQAYFFINPYAKRNLVIEVPHSGTETDTALQGARIFKDRAARALIINKERRCSDPDERGCQYGTTAPCDGHPPRQSDVAHNTDNTFTLLHKRFSADPAADFAQLHGFGEAAGRKRAVIGDGTTRDTASGSVANTFANHLRGQVSDAAGVVSCQEAGTPNPAFCGETNVQGRYTDGGDACLFTTNGGTRFLHLEQSMTLRDDEEGGDGAGMSWRDVSIALKLTWPTNYMNNGAADDTLGPRQTQYAGQSCGGTTSTLNAKVTFYGWPDNDDGNGNFGTNVIAHHRVWLGQSRPVNGQGDPVASGIGSYANPITVAATACCRPGRPSTSRDYRSTSWWGTSAATALPTGLTSGW